MAKKIVTVFLFILIFICGCGKKTVESINLSIPNKQTEYDINTEIYIKISVLPEGVDTSTLEYIADEGITFTDSQVITGNTEGTYYFYVTSGDIQSNVLSIKVVDIVAREEAVARWLEKEQEAEEQRQTDEQADREAEEQRLADEQAAKEAEEQAAKEATAQQQVEEQAAGQATQNAQTSEPVAESSGTQNNTPNSSGDADNFNTYDNSSQQQTEATFVLNTHTMKIHHPSCSSVKKIAPQNYATSNDSLDDLISQGYSICGNCFK